MGNKTSDGGKANRKGFSVPGGTHLACTITEGVNAPDPCGGSASGDLERLNQVYFW